MTIGEAARPPIEGACYENLERSEATSSPQSGATKTPYENGEMGVRPHLRGNRGPSPFAPKPGDTVRPQLMREAYPVAAVTRPVQAEPPYRRPGPDSLHHRRCCSIGYALIP